MNAIAISKLHAIFPHLKFRAWKLAKSPVHKYGRVTELAECTGLENRRRETYRGFESHPFRHLSL